MDKQSAPLCAESTFPENEAIKWEDNIDGNGKVRKKSYFYSKKRNDLPLQGNSIDKT